jgi:hypothetical protein
VYSSLSILAGISSFGFGNPAALPVFGLAFGSAALLRESRGARRRPVLLTAGFGCIVCGLGTLVSLMLVHR